MGRRLRGLVGALKDTASLPAAATSSASLAVLLATPHLPSSHPPSPRRLLALLSFGRRSRPSAHALVHALANRLRSAAAPAVALKSLLALHHLLSHAPFILQDQLQSLASTPLQTLDSTPFPFADWALAPWIPFLAALLHRRIAAKALAGDGDEDGADRLAGLLDRDLILEIDALVSVVEEIAGAPAMVGVEGNRLVGEVVGEVARVRVWAERQVWVRVREMGCRVGSVGFGDAVELGWVLRRFKGCRSRPLDWGSTVDDWFWGEIKGFMDRVETVVLEKEEERRVSRDKVVGSARIGDRSWGLGLGGSSQVVRFGSSRWDKC